MRPRGTFGRFGNRASDDLFEYRPGRGEAGKDLESELLAFCRQRLADPAGHEPGRPGVPPAAPPSGAPGHRPSVPGDGVGLVGLLEVLDLFGAQLD
jgi:hypothetical protein